MSDFVIIDENKKDNMSGNVHNQTDDKNQSFFGKLDAFVFSLQGINTKQKLLMNYNLHLYVQFILFHGKSSRRKNKKRALKKALN
jgi:hypothetical protein